MKRCDFCHGRIWFWQKAMRGIHMSWHLACWHLRRKALLGLPMPSEGRSRLEELVMDSAGRLNDPEHVRRQQKLRAEEEDRL
jgi:hypothetical protein